LPLSQRRNQRCDSQQYPNVFLTLSKYLSHILKIEASNEKKGTVIRLKALMKGSVMSRQIIMVISSRQDHCKLISDCLEQAGYQVRIAHLGYTALDMLRHEKPDLMLLDWKLPDLSGLAVIRSVRSDRQNANLLIILEGMDMKEEDVMLGLEVGADMCLKEPFHPKVIVARIRALLRRCYA
jgi:PleD family two-component response regulator